VNFTASCPYRNQVSDGEIALPLVVKRKCKSPGLSPLSFLI
jgi:hypothetical protein